MSAPIDDAALDRLFRQSRSRNAWKEETLPESTWRELYDLLKFGPTSMNLSPARFVFVTTAEGKARLGPHLMESNRAKMLQAPCTVIVARDMDFYTRLPELFPHKPEYIGMFQNSRALSDVTAIRNATLQGAYLMIAARALGLDVGPMSGFDNAGVDKEFFAGTALQSDFICSLGHGVDESFERLPKLAFEDACQVV